MGEARLEWLLWWVGRALVMGAAFLPLAPAAAAELSIVPQTRLRLTVLQWMPVEGEYRRLDTFGGDLMVLPNGAVSVPVIGQVPVIGKDASTISVEVAERIQVELGLISPPEVSLDVLEYPPIYVVGAVAAPGQFPYRPGFTVLQALALGGGQMRPEPDEGTDSDIRLRSELLGIEDDILRTMARTARLRAELQGLAEIDFPEEVTSQSQLAPISEVIAQEQALFEARAGAIERQSQSYSDLIELLETEIAALEERIAALDEEIASLLTELERVSQLVATGNAVVSRRTDVERLISGARADRLDHLTAIMRSRQSISEAERNQLNLRDQMQTEAVQELLVQEATLEDLYLQRETSQQLLAELANASLGSNRPTLEPPVLRFSIVRLGEDGMTETEADEFSELLPGDVLKVTLSEASFTVATEP